MPGGLVCKGPGETSFSMHRTAIRIPHNSQCSQDRSAEYRLIDLFAGCGGMTLGFVWDNLFGPGLDPTPLCRPSSELPASPFRVVLANDFDEAALATYVANFDPAGGHAMSGSVEDLLKEKEGPIPKADVIIGGPPCQGFSLLNKQRDGDERRSLWWHFMEVAERSEAKVLVMENVPQLIGSVEFQRMLMRLRELGFNHYMAHVLCAANYGVPQTRHRAIIMASRVGPIALPLPTHLEGDRLLELNGDRLSWPALERWTDVRSAIADLPEPIGTEIRDDASPTERLHFGRQPTSISRQRYQAVPYGGNRFDLQRAALHITPSCWVRKTSGGTDLFGRLWWERPSVTIRTEFFKPEKGRYLHPVAHRPITHREAARLQSFPDRFNFEGTKIEIARQIGNAVPPLLAFAIARRVVECLEGKTTEQDMHRTRVAFRALLRQKVDGLRHGSTI
jgi:DNA (cytosine-5)-methyltransferase 1